jgi:hypothetical protein
MFLPSLLLEGEDRSSFINVVVCSKYQLTEEVQKPNRVEPGYNVTKGTGYFLLL